MPAGCTRYGSEPGADVVPGDEFVFVPNSAPPPAPAPGPATSTANPATSTPAPSTSAPSTSAPAQTPGPSPPPLLVRATTVRQYDTFAAMLAAEGLAACLPGLGGGLEAGVGVYRAIPGYGAHEAAGLGVVAVGLELLAARFAEEEEEEGGGGGVC
ncbi:hypothetical protein HXX76_010904 [Chlamydomonas incerta]|uniref:Uncharacterized protein n=1 Tax=Chlamydomonas incerta TaxID=51695 RepID=A0A835SUT5_CHLIN|nr:hypothetical protein HXX76_010904 [Chlamydomonas incerta]|eukprot:KAG2427185.1 hypothetical protein HXX76_010904 [Chlamydomonas incerta]